MYNLSVFIFTRDIRKEDNLALIKALKESKKVLPIFIFTPEQTRDNSRFSDNCFQFLITSLVELVKSVPVQFFYGEFQKTISSIKKKTSADAAYISMDYTPFAKKREKKLAKVFNNSHIVENHLLTGIETLKNGNGLSYTIYSAFRNKFKKVVDVDKPISNRYTNYYKTAVPGSKSLKSFNSFYKHNSNIHVKGGRKEALKILSNISDHKDYAKQRNFPARSTTNLSAHNKFGTVSIREVYWQFNKKVKKTGLIDQLIWREFYYHILYFNPTVLTSNFNPKWDKFKWSNRKNFDKWKAGETGFPIVDAGMRQLEQTGFMHNRCRMIVAMFLTKNLRIDWKHGEKYFSQKLVDYDPAQNNGNWQWIGGSGVDPLRYGKPRYMNPWSQQKTYDPDCKYIKKWIVELKDVPCKDIHKWDQRYKDYDVYLAPILDFDETIKEFLKYSKIVT